MDYFRHGDTWPSHMAYRLQILEWIKRVPLMAITFCEWVWLVITLCTSPTKPLAGAHLFHMVPSFNVLTEKKQNQFVQEIFVVAWQQELHKCYWQSGHTKLIWEKELNIPYSLYNRYFCQLFVRVQTVSLIRFNGLSFVVYKHRQHLQETKHEPFNIP